MAVLVLLVGGWLTVAVGGAAVLRRGQPDRALGLAPWDARAHSEAAEQALAQGGVDRPALVRAEREARAALARSPLMVPAWRTLGLVSAARGRDRLAAALFSTSERLSRRDLPTQLWLIEEQVRRGDVARALEHYDVALRTSPLSFDTLLPILVQAAGSVETGPALGRLLQARPLWANNFYYRVGQSTPADSGEVARTLEIARRGGPISNPDALRAIVSTMVERGDYRPALRVAAVLGGVPARLPKGVANGGFERQPDVAPFDWMLAQGLGFGAELRGGLGKGAQALVAFTTSDANGTAARQLLVLRPGTYRLRWRAGRTDAPAPERMTWRLACAKGAAVAEAPVDLTRRGGEAAFSVPAGCAAQWLSLDILSDSPEGSEAWVDDVAVVPAG